MAAAFNNAEPSQGACLLRGGWLALAGNRARVLISVLLLFASAIPTRAQIAEEFPEYQLKAAFLYNFAKYIHWPSNTAAKSPLTIGVLGDDPFGTLLPATIAGKTVNDHSLKLKYLKRDDPIADVDILFVSRSERERVPSVLAGLQGKSVLTVADMDRFGQQGGMINLILVGKSVRFEMNVEAIERAGLKVNSKLGNLGIVVKTEEERE